MSTILLYCGHSADADATGTAIDSSTGWRICEACAAAVERNNMLCIGNALLYLTSEAVEPPNQAWKRFVVTDWLGGLRFNAFNYRHSKHGGGFGAKREDFDFIGPDGHIWHGIVRGDSQAARCRRSKKLSSTLPNRNACAVL